MNASLILICYVILFVSKSVIASHKCYECVVTDTDEEDACKDPPARNKIARVHCPKGEKYCVQAVYNVDGGREVTYRSCGTQDFCTNPEKEVVRHIKKIVRKTALSEDNVSKKSCRICTVDFCNGINRYESSLLLILTCFSVLNLL